MNYGARAERVRKTTHAASRAEADSGDCGTTRHNALPHARANLAIGFALRNFQTEGSTTSRSG